jgi:hypothetical protein
MPGQISNLEKSFKTAGNVVSTISNIADLFAYISPPLEVIAEPLNLLSTGFTVGNQLNDLYKLSKDKKLTPNEKAVEDVTIATEILPYKHLADVGEKAIDVIQANYNNFTKGKGSGISEPAVNRFFDNFSSKFLGWK